MRNVTHIYCDGIYSESKVTIRVLGHQVLAKGGRVHESITTHAIVYKGDVPQQRLHFTAEGTVFRIDFLKETIDPLASKNMGYNVISVSSEDFTTAQHMVVTKTITVHS